MRVHSVRALGNDLSVLALGLGCMGMSEFYGAPDEEQSIAMIHRVLDLGATRICSLGSHVRMTWQPKGWPRASLIQVRVLPKGEKSVIAFHQEYLTSAEERERRRAHFKAALKELERLIASTT